MARAVHRPTRLPAVRELAPQARCPSRYSRRPRPARNRGRDDAHRRRVQLTLLETAGWVPTLPQSGGDVWARPDLVLDDRASLLVAQDAPTPATQRDRNELGARDHPWGDRLACRSSGVDPRTGADRHPRRHFGSVDVLCATPVRGRLLGELRALELRRRGAARELLSEAA